MTAYDSTEISVQNASLPATHEKAKSALATCAANRAMQIWRKSW